MAKDPSEAVSRIKSILETIEQKSEDVSKAKSSILRLNIELERAELALKNSRVQLLKELEKFDPEISDAFRVEVIGRKVKEELEAVSG